MKLLPVRIFLASLAFLCAGVAVWQHVVPHQFWYYESVTHAQAPAEELEKSLRAFAGTEPVEIERLGERTVGYRFYGESPAAANQRAFLAFRYTDAAMRHQGFGGAWRAGLPENRHVASPDSRFAWFWMSLPAIGAVLAAIFGGCFIVLSRTERPLPPMLVA